MLLKQLAPTHQKILRKRIEELIEFERKSKRNAQRMIRKRDKRIKMLKEILKNKRPTDHIYLVTEAD